MRILLIAALVAMSAPVTANASGPTDKQANILTHAANAMALEEKCPVVKIQWPLLEGAMDIHGIKSADMQPGGRLADYMVLKMTEARETLTGKDRDTACRLAIALYGPQGTNVKNLIKETP